METETAPHRGSWRYAQSTKSRMRRNSSFLPCRGEWVVAGSRCSRGGGWQAASAWGMGWLCPGPPGSCLNWLRLEADCCGDSRPSCLMRGSQCFSTLLPAPLGTCADPPAQPGCTTIGCAAPAHLLPQLLVVALNPAAVLPRLRLQAGRGAGKAQVRHEKANGAAAHSTAQAAAAAACCRSAVEHR